MGGAGVGGGGGGAEGVGLLTLFICPRLEILWSHLLKEMSVRGLVPQDKSFSNLAVNNTLVTDKLVTRELDCALLDINAFTLEQLPDPIPASNVQLLSTAGNVRLGNLIQIAMKLEILIPLTNSIPVAMIDPSLVPSTTPSGAITLSNSGNGFAIVLGDDGVITALPFNPTPANEIIGFNFVYLL